MNLTQGDLDQIRVIIREESSELKFDMSDLKIGISQLQLDVGHLSRRIDNMEETVGQFYGRIMANENDIKDIYKILDHKVDVAESKAS